MLTLPTLQPTPKPASIILSYLWPSNHFGLAGDKLRRGFFEPSIKLFVRFSEKASMLDCSDVLIDRSVRPPTVTLLEG